jgi:hypothetical protein
MWPSHCVRLVPRPKNRWAGRHFGPSRGPAWAKFGLLVASRSQPSSATDLDPTAVHGFRRNKSRPVADALNPSPFFSPPPLFSQRTSGGGVAQSAAGSSLATARSAARHTAATVSPLLFSILSFPLLLYSVRARSRESAMTTRRGKWWWRRHGSSRRRARSPRGRAHCRRADVRRCPFGPNRTVAEAR